MTALPATASAPSPCFTSIFLSSVTWAPILLDRGGGEAEEGCCADEMPIARADPATTTMDATTARAMRRDDGSGVGRQHDDDMAHLLRTVSDSSSVPARRPGRADRAARTSRPPI